MILTSEDLLKAMGLKVNDVFYMPNPSYKYKVVLEKGKIYVKDFIFQEYMLIEDFIKSRKMINREFTIIQPKPILTEDEKVILRNLPKEFKYIQRDESVLCVSEDKPIRSKYGDYWTTEKDDEVAPTRIYILNHLFQFIKWEDEPY